jgi:hypothetical protein
MGVPPALRSGVRAFHSGDLVRLQDRLVARMGASASKLGRTWRPELARAGARGCRRQAARRAPKVLRRSGRHRGAFRGRIAPARQETRHVIRFSCQAVLSRGEVAPSARGALRAPLKTCRYCSPVGGIEAGSRLGSHEARHRGCTKSAPWAQPQIPAPVSAKRPPSWPGWRISTAESTRYRQSSSSLPGVGWINLPPSLSSTRARVPQPGQAYIGQQRLQPARPGWR